MKRPEGLAMQRTTEFDLRNQIKLRIDERRVTVAVGRSQREPRMAAIGARRAGQGEASGQGVHRSATDFTTTLYRIPSSHASTFSAHSFPCICRPLALMWTPVPLFCRYSPVSVSVSGPCSACPSFHSAA